MSRYSRQEFFTGIGKAGQQKISALRVMVAGCGALGSNSASMLARAGVGFLRIVDRDFVELNNLQRQVLFTEEDARNSVPKAAAAANAIVQINSEVKVEPVIADMNAFNVENLIRDVDLVVDGFDNYDSRFVLNDACVKAGKTWFYGACIGAYGLAMAVFPGRGPCFRCIAPKAPPADQIQTCDTAGILNTIVAIVSGFQVSELLKTAVGVDFKPALFTVDVWRGYNTSFEMNRVADCECCAKRNFTYLAGTREQVTTTLCGRNSVQILPVSETRVNLQEMNSRIKAACKSFSNQYLVRFFPEEGIEVTLFSDGRAIIAGTTDTVRAKALYARYIGS